MKKLIGILLIIAVLFTSFVFTGTATAEIEKKFVVDGNLDIWYLTEEENPEDDYHYYYMSSLEAIYRDGVSFCPDPETHAEVYTAYDDTYVYVYAKVWDEEIIPYDGNGAHSAAQGGNSSWADSLEIWFDPDPNSQTHFADGTERPAKGTLSPSDFATNDDYRKAVEESGEVEDNWCNQTDDKDQGDVQVRLLAYDMQRHDYHDAVKPGYNGVSFATWIKNPENFCAFTFANEPVEIELTGATVSSGYGVEARFPRNDDQFVEFPAYRVHVAANNSSDWANERYALATGSAWWMDFNTAIEIVYAEENPFFQQEVGDQTVKYTDSEINKSGAGGAVVTAIDALPDTITEADKAAVQAVVDSYSNLTDLQKGYVQYKNFADLKAAAEAVGIEIDEGTGGGNNNNGGNVDNPIVVPLPTYTPGDVNADNDINALDALAVLKAAVGKAELTGDAFLAGDMDGNETLNALDALAILKKAVGK